MLTLRKPLVAALALFSISPALAVEPDDLLVGPINYQQDVNGVSVTLTVRTYFKIQTIDNKIYLKAQVISDLGDLQRKIGTIVEPRAAKHHVGRERPQHGYLVGHAGGVRGLGRECVCIVPREVP